MNERSFTVWLEREATTAKYALLALYEQRDKLKYIDGPRLEKEYMEKVGTFEETVIKEEIECELLQEKQQMIQAAINRRESIDVAAIDAEIDVKRQRLFKEAEGVPPQDYADLSVEQSEELQETYRKIVNGFHPQMHPELTEAHRRLFEKAQEAYRRKDIQALKLIYEMLMNAQHSGIELLAELMVALEITPGDGGEEKALPTDYSLVAELYSSFVPTSEEAAIREECVRCRQLTEEVMEDMEEMRGKFPYTAAEMLADPAKLESYKEALVHRLHTATVERERRAKQIEETLERVKAHE